MAIGKRKQAFSNYKLKALKIVNKIKDQKTQKDINLMPSGFQIKEKNSDGKWDNLPGIEYQVSGDLYKIVLDKGEYNGSEYDIIKLFMVDNDVKESYVLDMRMGIASRSIFNSIINLEDYNDISISFYKKEVDGKAYSNVAVRQKETLIKGKFLNKDLPEVEIVKNSKGEIVKRDYKEIDNFYLNHLKDLVGKLQKSNSSKLSDNKNKKNPAKNEPDEIINEVEDIGSEQDAEIPF